MDAAIKPEGVSSKACNFKEDEGNENNWTCRWGKLGINNGLL